MKILSLTNTPLDPALGSGKTVLAWSQGLRLLGHDVDVIPPDDFYRPWPKNLAKRLKMRLDAVKLSNIVLSGGYDLVEFYGAEFGLLSGKLSQVSRNNRPLLVAHTNGLELAASEFSSDVAINSSFNAFQYITGKVINPIISKIDAMAFTRVDAFASICEADKNFLVNHGLQPSSRCAVVEPGIDEVYLSSPWQRRKNQWLVSFASWASRKDPETTVRVASELLRQIPDLEFHILGASGSKHEILNAFAEHQRSRIKVYPRLSQGDIVEILSQAKVFLFPSLYEGFGMATTEALACGCAVVVTPTGFGTSIQDGLDGFVCNFQDVALMTRRCLDLFLDEGLRNRISFAGRERVSCLNWPVQLQKLEAIYQYWLQSI